MGSFIPTRERGAPVQPAILGKKGESEIVSLGQSQSTTSWGTGQQVQKPRKEKGKPGGFFFKTTEEKKKNQKGKAVARPLTGSERGGSASRKATGKVKPTGTRGGRGERDIRKGPTKVPEQKNQKWEEGVRSTRGGIRKKKRN